MNGEWFLQEEISFFFSKDNLKQLSIFFSKFGVVSFWWFVNLTSEQSH